MKYFVRFILMLGGGLAVLCGIGMLDISRDFIYLSMAGCFAMAVSNLIES